MRRLLFAPIVLLFAASATAQTSSPTVRDILELTKAGLGEEVLLALIEVNRPVFPVDAETLKTLKQGGVPQSVIVAMVKSGREPQGPPPDLAPAALEPPPAPAPPVVIIEEPEPRVREVAVPYAVPVYVAVPVRPSRIHGAQPPRVKAPEPVYWGWGGKLRPDAWKTAADVQPDAKVPREPQKK